MGSSVAGLLIVAQGTLSELTDRRGFLLWPALAMSLGWGLRGYVGGGPFGAMIPGAMVALVLCRLLGVAGERAALAAAFGAVGVGFGGEMTYGQTVGFVRESATLAWGLAGLALKGAVWGLTGGAFVAAGLGNVQLKRLARALAAFLAAVALGWAAINQPKLVYFSNLLDRPREEVWAGLLLGGLAFAFLLRDVPWMGRFALAGFLGGGLGFGLGGVWIFIGEQVNPAGAPWWKLMEFTFGALFGAALGWAARALPREDPSHGALGGARLVAVASLPLLAAVFWLEPFVPVRFSYAVVGALLLLAATAWSAVRLPIALTLTSVAFFADWAEYHDRDPVLGSRETGWTLAILAAAAFAWAVSRTATTRAAFWLLTGAAVAVAMTKGAITSVNAEHALFALLAASLLAFEKKAGDASPAAGSQAEVRSPRRG